MHPSAVGPTSTRTAALLAVAGGIGWAGLLHVFRDSGVWGPLAAFGAALGLVALLRMPRLRGELVPRAGAVATGTALGIAMAAVTWGGWYVAAQLFPALQGDVGALYGIVRRWPSPLAAVGLLAVLVIAEELVWRGALLPVLHARIGAPGAVVVGAALYAVGQAGIGSALLPAVGFACGLAWGTAYLRVRRLDVPIAMHLAWDVLVLVLWPLDRL